MGEGVCGARQRVRELRIAAVCGKAPELVKGRHARPTNLLSVLRGSAVAATREAGSEATVCYCVSSSEDHPKQVLSMGEHRPQTHACTGSGGLNWTCAGVSAGRTGCPRPSGPSSSVAAPRAGGSAATAEAVIMVHWRMPESGQESRKLRQPTKLPAGGCAVPHVPVSSVHAYAVAYILLLT